MTAMPLEPSSGMFPGLAAEPFIDAPELSELVSDVIASYDEFDPIGAAIREYDLSIACVFETKPFDPLKEDIHPHTIAKVTKASPLWLALTDRVRLVTPPGGTVLDPFVGSGTTAVAALGSGRRCVAMDIDEAYIAIALRRLRLLRRKTESEAAS